MATQPSFTDIFGAAKTEALARPTRLTPEIFEVEGSDVNIAMASGAAMAEETAAFAQGEINATRLRTAGSVSEEALEQWGASEVDEQRRGALSAIVPIVFARSVGGPTVIPAQTIVGTAGGVTFTTIAAINAGNGEVGPFTAFALASTAGPGGNVGANSITEILSTLADPTWTCNNPEPASGGTDVETPADYQARCQTAYRRARRGTLAAIEADAAAVEGVASARAFELLDGDGQTGRVVLQILGFGGTTNSALAARVREAMNSTRAAGVPVIVQAINPRTVAVRATGLLVLAGFDPATVLGQAADAITAYLRALTPSSAIKPGATLRRAKLLSLLAETEGLEVPDGALLEPAADVIPAAGEYLTTERALVQLSPIA